MCVRAKPSPKSLRAEIEFRNRAPETSPPAGAASAQNYHCQLSVNKNADSLERENGASFYQLWMGNLVIYILLWQPVCTRQQQAAAGSSNICCTIRRTIRFIYVLAHPLLANRCGESCQFCGAKKGVKPDMSRR